MKICKDCQCSKKLDGQLVCTRNIFKCDYAEGNHRFFACDTMRHLDCYCGQDGHDFVPRLVQPKLSIVARIRQLLGIKK